MKIFLLAHQDDEVFFLPHIHNSEEKLFIYLTNGVSKTSSSKKAEKRAFEADRIFTKYLYPFNSNVIWWGNEQQIPEGELHNFITNSNLLDLSQIVSNYSKGDALLVTSTFEGAHQDHDSAAIITRRIAQLNHLQIIEMPTYPMRETKHYSFRVMHSKHKLERIDFKRVSSLKLSLQLMYAYKTQFRTWLGLGVFVCLKYAFGQNFSSEPKPLSKIEYCFYEYRNRSTQAQVLDKLSNIAGMK